MTELLELNFRSDIPVTKELWVGSDDDIIKAMFASTQNDVCDDKGRIIDPNTNKPMTDAAKQGRINYLMRFRHGTPFENAGIIKFWMDAPIKVYREFHRHRIGWSFNEESGRYSELRPDFYIADRDRNLVQTGKVGHYIFEPGSDEQYALYKNMIKTSNWVAYTNYQQMLAAGIAKEVARDCLPVNIYSRQQASANPRSIMAFLSLRTAREAYWDPEDSGEWDGWYEANPGGAMFPSKPMREIEMVADQIEAYFKEHYPMTWRAFDQNGRVGP